MKKLAHCTAQAYSKATKSITSLSEAWNFSLQPCNNHPFHRETHVRVSQPSKNNFKIISKLSISHPFAMQSSVGESSQRLNRAAEREREDRLGNHLTYTLPHALMALYNQPLLLLLLLLQLLYLRFRGEENGRWALLLLLLLQRFSEDLYAQHGRARSFITTREKTRYANFEFPILHDDGLK